MTYNSKAVIATNLWLVSFERKLNVTILLFIYLSILRHVIQISILANYTLSLYLLRTQRIFCKFTEVVPLNRIYYLEASEFE